MNKGGRAGVLISTPRRLKGFSVRFQMLAGCTGRQVPDFNHRG
jgi:hypothetical protein